MDKFLRPSMSLEKEPDLSRFLNIFAELQNLEKKYDQTIKFYENNLEKNTNYYAFIIIPVIVSIIINGLGLYTIKQLVPYKIWINVLSIIIGLIFLSLMSIVLVFRKNMVEFIDKLSILINQKLPENDILERYNIVSITCGIMGFWSFVQGWYKILKT